MFLTDVLGSLFFGVLKNPRQGAMTSFGCSVKKDIASGAFYSDGIEINTPILATKDENVNALYEATEAIIQQLTSKTEESEYSGTNTTTDTKEKEGVHANIKKR